MKQVNKKITIISVISLLLVLIVSLAVLLLIKVEDTAAAPEDTIEIKVNKVTTVSIYVFGSGVEFVSSNSNYDTYTAEVGTTVRLQSVNETRIFTELHGRGSAPAQGHHRRHYGAERSGHSAGDRAYF